MIPFLTVGIPAYENESGLLRALDSVAQQTLKDLEILISDDHSKNRLEPYVDKWRSEHPDINVRYHYQETNLHITRNKKWIIENGLGRLIAFLEHDDILTDENFYLEAKNLYLANSHIKAIIANATITSPLKGERFFKGKLPFAQRFGDYQIYKPRRLMRLLLANWPRTALCISWSSLVLEKEAAIGAEAFSYRYLTTPAIAKSLQSFPHEDHMICLFLIHDRNLIAATVKTVSHRNLPENSFSKSMGKHENLLKYPNNIEFFNYLRASRMTINRLTKTRFIKKAIKAGLKINSKEVNDYIIDRPSDKIVVFAAVLFGRAINPITEPIQKLLTRIQRIGYLMIRQPRYFFARIRNRKENFESFD